MSDGAGVAVGARGSCPGRSWWPRRRRSCRRGRPWRCAPWACAASSSTGRPVPAGDLADRLQSAHLAEEVDGQDRPGARRDRAPRSAAGRSGGSRRSRPAPAGAGAHDAQRGGDEGVGGHDAPRRRGRCPRARTIELDRVGAVGDADAVGDVPQKRAKASSNSRTSGPRMKAVSRHHPREAARRPRRRSRRAGPSGRPAGSASRRPLIRPSPAAAVAQRALEGVEDAHRGGAAPAVGERPRARRRCTRGSGRTRRCSGSPVATLGISDVALADAGAERGEGVDEARADALVGDHACRRCGPARTGSCRRRSACPARPTTVMSRDLARVEPGDVEVDHDAVRVAEGGEDGVLDARVDPGAALAPPRPAAAAPSQ